MKKLVLLLSSFIIIGCALPIKEYGNDEKQDSLNNFCTEPLNNLFNLEKDTEGKSFYEFKSNNFSFLSDTGYTIFTDQFDDDEILCDVIKNDGSNAGGYGVVFNFYEEKETRSFLVVMINGNRSYCIGKVENNKFIFIVPWIYSYEYIKPATENNSIEIKHDDSSKEYQIYINGNLIQNVDVTSNVEKTGFVCVITPVEDFEHGYVWCQFYKK